MSESTPHDYEPGDGRHPMQTDPRCRICGGPKGHKLHERDAAGGGASAEPGEASP